MTSKSLPKSLHTITVLVNVAKIIKGDLKHGDANAVAVQQAMEALGYDISNDPYRLADKAVSILDKGA